jgi:hypothetical protein
MPKRSRRSLVVLSMGVLSLVAWSGRALADEPAPPPPEPPAALRPGVPDEDRFVKNSVFAEGLGPGLFYSINYERMVIDEELGIRIGLDYLSFTSSVGAGPETTKSTTTFFGVPITASYVGIRSGKSSLELGGGVTLFYFGGSTSSGFVATSGSGIVPLGVAMVGYRLQPVDHAGFMFRVGMSALAAPGLSFSPNNPGAFGVIPWPYISFGASF